MPEAEELSARLDNYRYELEDIGEQARMLTDGSDMENPEKQLNAIEARLSLIERLRRKYGNTIAEIRQFRAESAARLADLESGDEKLSEIESEIRKLRAQLSEKAAVISARRREAGERLGRAVTETLIYLDMPTEITERMMRAREQSTNTKADIHEQDEAYLKRCRANAKEIVGDSGWIVVDCAAGDAPRSIEDIHEEVWRIASSIL